jgi:ABC-type polysaccharide/polyol phosphate export permease
LKQGSSVFQDFQRAIRQHLVWLHLGLLDVRQKYRRSVLGPWWISLSMLIFIAVMSLLFSRLFAEPLSQYITFFTAGFMLWSFISTCMNESTEIFRLNSSFIKQINLPYNIYVLKFITKNTIILAHNFVVYLLVMCLFKVNPGWTCLLAIPGMILLLLNMYWICLLIALISTRFRDMVPIINSGVQILFFVTPISWMPKLIGETSIMIKLNPFVYFIEVVRQPLLGIVPAPTTWAVMIGLTCVGFVLSQAFFGYKRFRIPFWVD